VKTPSALRGLGHLLRWKRGREMSGWKPDPLGCEDMGEDGVTRAALVARVCFCGVQGLLEAVGCRV
jgi:hypothetical protein